MDRKLWLAAVAGAVLLAGCTGSGDVSPTQTHTMATSSTPMVTTAPPTTATQTDVPETSPEEAAAMQAVVDFWELRDELGINPEVGVTSLAEVARGQAFDVHSRALFDQAREGLRQVGSGHVTPTSALPGDDRDQMIVSVCLDVSDVDVVDSDGNSVVPSGRPSKVAYDYTVELDGERWYVIEDLLESKAC